jgi:alanine racemase
MQAQADNWPPRAVAHVDLDAIAANCGRLIGELTGDSSLCAVVKADGYGHGMAPAARAALAGGATRLAVVTVEEAEALAREIPEVRDGAVPVLMMAPVAPPDLGRAVATGAELTVWTKEHVEQVARAAAASASSQPVRLHVKRDTGMGRFGARDDREALAALAAAAAADGVEAHAVWTHFATADEPDGSYFEDQLYDFERFAALAREQHPGLLAHAANSAATLREPRSHLNFVRCGIAVYGLDPLHEDAAAHGLTPALTLKSRVAALRGFAPGTSAGYGRRFVASEPTQIATVPIGYGDGWRRILSGRAEVLIRGRRHPQVGTVSMDSITVDVGLDSEIETGDAVTLIGRDGNESITAEQVALQAETINYEITCGLTPRTVREHRGAGGAAA